MLSGADGDAALTKPECLANECVFEIPLTPRERAMRSRPLSFKAAPSLII